MNLTIKESENLRDSVIQSKVELRKEKVGHLSLLKTLKNKTLTNKEELLSLEDSVLNAELDEFNTFELAPIVDKLSDGLSRIPTETISNPMEIVDNLEESETIITSTVKDELARIELKYLELLEKNTRTAKDYLKINLERLKKEGKLPK
jgi:hypothetical protein